VIRPIEEHDLPGVLAVYRQSQDFLALGPNPIATPEMVKQDIAHSRREGSLYCGIFNMAGQTIGVLDYLPSHFEGQPEQAFISLLMIAAPYRRRGLGQQVIRQIEAEIHKNDQIRTISTAVQVNNPQALRFWQKNGYRIVSGPEVQADRTVTYQLQKEI
jgi:ribosomal protein S18 acetylase RimI-like enzyme